MEQRNFGDRFKWIADNNNPSNVYILEHTDKGFIVVDKGHMSCYKIGEVWCRDITVIYESPDLWTYLGNFSKSNRFKEIYDILNS